MIFRGGQVLAVQLEIMSKKPLETLEQLGTIKKWMSHHKSDASHEELQKFIDKVDLSKEAVFTLCPLSYAVVMQCHECIELLLKNGANRQEAIKDMQDYNRTHGEYYQHLFTGKRPTNT
jgi:hypothetical protein